MYHVIFKAFENSDPLPISRVAFTIFGKEIYWYGVLITIGIILSAVYAFYRAKKLGIRIDDMYDYAIFIIVFGVLGARAFYVLTKLENFHSFYDVISIWNGGLAIYGGIIAGILTVVIVSKVKHIKILRVLDAIAPAVMIGQALGRWGNFFNQEAFGCNTTLPWGMKSEATASYLNDYISNHSEEIQKLGMKINAEGYVHPTFLYECLWNVIGFIIINIFYKKRKFDGQMFLMYLTWYGLGRAFIEMLRTDSLFIPGTYIRISMVIGFVCFAGGLAAMIVLGLRAKKNPETVKEGAYYGKASDKNDPDYKKPGKKEKTESADAKVEEEITEDNEEEPAEEPQESDETPEAPDETEEPAEAEASDSAAETEEAETTAEPEEEKDGENN